MKGTCFVSTISVLRFVLQHMVCLSVCSLNVRGKRDLLKRKAVFLFCKNFKYDFYFIQETHASMSDYNFWKSQWGDDLWMSYGTNHSAGVATLKGRLHLKGK